MVCVCKGAHTQRLNHIISTQIINDIIFGCSVYNAGQLDARGNKVGVRERQNRRIGTKKMCVEKKREGGS